MEYWKSRRYNLEEDYPDIPFSYNQTDGEMSCPPISRETSVEDSEGSENKLVNFEMGRPEKNIIYNIKALNKNEPTYKLEAFEKNFLMVFNQENIEGHDPRRGTEKDVEALERTFGKYGFEVQVHKDLTKAEILEELKVFNEKDFTEYGCVAVAVLTHGTFGGLLRAKDQQYNETDIIHHFKTHDKPTLITKPKLLIIQACRGTRPIRGVFAKQSTTIHRDLDEEFDPYTLPIESDMLVFHSSYMGNPSHRDELHGSWFIQTLCREIDRLSPAMDIESIMTEVKRAVAIDMEHEVRNRATGDIDINKQMPVLSSTLIRKLYLKQYMDTAPSLSLCDGEVTVNRNEVLDGPAPETPSLTQLEPCLCFLSHFDYLRQCLRHYVEENPDDETAQSYLEICKNYKDVTDFNDSKETMVRLISQHLEKKVPEIEHLKYLYLYKNL